MASNRRRHLISSDWPLALDSLDFHTRHICYYQLIRINRDFGQFGMGLELDFFGFFFFFFFFFFFLAFFLSFFLSGFFYFFQFHRRLDTLDTGTHTHIDAHTHTHTERHTHTQRHTHTHARTVVSLFFFSSASCLLLSFSLLLRTRFDWPAFGPVPALAAVTPTKTQGKTTKIPPNEK